MSKYVKGMMIDIIANRLEGTADYVVVDASKLDAITNNKFRMSLRQSGIQMMAVKNALAINALAKNGIEATKDVFNGPCSIVWGSGDIVELAKEISKWSKELEPLEIRGGAVDGQSIDADSVEQWSKAKGRLETIADIAGCLVGPGSELAGAMVGPSGELASQIEQVSEGDE